MHHDEHNEHDDLLPHSAQIWAQRDDSPHQQGDRVGVYTIESLLGEGGCGLVYKAHQSQPVQRTVALKILKPGMDSRQVVLRFEAERQALAMMDHPSVAKVFDAGQTEHGRPYIAMEYVQGVPITTFCNSNQLNIQLRLELFIQVCHAVQHAHAKGVVHRDLKPGNVLVTESDGTPHAMVIDFGVAKALQAKLGDETLVTQHGQLIGTPAYMSPEQADLDERAIDIRSDVYSLGVVLYELLAGVLPFDVPTNVGMTAMRRFVTEATPQRLSTRVGEDPQAVERAAVNRQVDQRTLQRLLRSDLEWIVMKCLEKDCMRRYQTVNELAMDLQRYLVNEPVIAGPPGASYRLRKLVQRHRGSVIAAGAIAAVLIGATVVSLRFAMAEAAQRQLAQANTQRALEAEAEATRRAQTLQMVAEFQSTMLSEIDIEQMGAFLRDDVLQQAEVAWRQAGVEEAQRAQRLDDLERLLAGTNFTNTAVASLDRNLLSHSLETLQRDFADEPLVNAALLQTIGESYLSIGMFEHAEVPFRQSLAIRQRELGQQHADTATSMHAIGMLYRQMSRYDEAADYLQRALDVRESILGSTHPATLAILCSFGSLLADQGKLDEAEVYCQRALAGRMQALGESHPQTLQSLSNLGTLKMQRGMVNEAVELYRRVFDGRQQRFGDDHPDTLVALNNLARTLREQGQFEEAEHMYRSALDGFRRTLGDAHRTTLSAMNNFGRVLREQRQFDDAMTYYQAALDGFERVLGEDHPDTLVAMNNLGRLYRSLGRMDEAEELYRRSLEGRRRVLGNDHMHTLTAVNNLAMLLLARGHYEEAEPFFLEALDGLQREFGLQHPNTIRMLGNIAQLMRNQAKHELAEQYYLQAIDLFSEVMGELHHETLNAINSYALLLQDMQRYAEAASTSEVLVKKARESLPEGHRSLGFYIAHYGRSLFEMAEYALAERAMIEAHEILRQSLGDGHARTTGLVADLVQLYQAWHEADPEGGYATRAEQWLALLD